MIIRNRVTSIALMRRGWVYWPNVVCVEYRRRSPVTMHHVPQLAAAQVHISSSYAYPVRQTASCSCRPKGYSIDGGWQIQRLCAWSQCPPRKGPGHDYTMGISFPPLWSTTTSWRTEGRPGIDRQEVPLSDP